MIRLDDAHPEAWPAADRIPTRKEIRREATKARLRAPARRLFAAHGYDDTSVTEIAREAGVTHGMINVYFNGKAGLLHDLLSEDHRARIARVADAETLEGDTLDRLMRVSDV